MILRIFERKKVKLGDVTVDKSHLTSKTSRGLSMYSQLEAGSYILELWIQKRGGNIRNDREIVLSVI
jgi:hypothetical protein